MSFETHLARARAELAAAQRAIQDEIAAYPTPIAGCDAQYNHLLGMRGAVSTALRALAGPQFIATPRTPAPGAGVETR